MKCDACSNHPRFRTSRQSELSVSRRTPFSGQRLIFALRRPHGLRQSAALLALEQDDNYQALVTVRGKRWARAIEDFSHLSSSELASRNTVLGKFSLFLRESSFFLPFCSTCTKYLTPSLRANSHLRRQCSRKAVKPSLDGIKQARTSTMKRNGFDLLRSMFGSVSRISCLRANT